jgi:small-conductance mechanosensitive channel
MNFFGWLIIMWRDLFVEGDYIEVGKYRGYVLDMGPLYFTMEEASEVVWGDKTGRVVKVPNSLIANNPIVNFSNDRSFVEGRVPFIFTFKSPVEKIQKIVPLIEVAIENELKSLHEQWSKRHQKEYAVLQLNMTNKPQFVIRVFQDKPSGVQLVVKYMSLKRDQRQIDEKIVRIVVEAVQADADMGLSVAT